MLNMIKGARIDSASNLFEGYKAIDERSLEANVNAENIFPVIEKFVEQDEAEQFALWIEEPSSLDNETILQEATSTSAGVIEQLHVDVYFLEGIEKDTIIHLLEPISEILVNDGLVRFGVVSERGNEIGKYKYNIMYGMSSEGDLSTVIAALEQTGISAVDSLKTAYDYFSEEHPGVSERFSLGELTVPVIIETLVEELGMNKVEQREE